MIKRYRKKSLKKKLLRNSFGKKSNIENCSNVKINIIENSGGGDCFFLSLLPGLRQYHPILFTNNNKKDVIILRNILLQTLEKNDPIDGVTYLEKYYNTMIDYFNAFTDNGTTNLNKLRADEHAFMIIYNGKRHPLSTLEEFKEKLLTSEYWGDESTLNFLYSHDLFKEILVIVYDSINNQLIYKYGGNIPNLVMTDKKFAVFICYSTGHYRGIEINNRVLHELNKDLAITPNYNTDLILVQNKKDQLFLINNSKDLKTESKSSSSSSNTTPTNQTKSTKSSSSNTKSKSTKSTKSSSSNTKSTKSTPLPHSKKSLKKSPKSTKSSSSKSSKSSSSKSSKSSSSSSGSDIKEISEEQMLQETLDENVNNLFKTRLRLKELNERPKPKREKNILIRQTNIHKLKSKIDKILEESQEIIIRLSEIKNLNDVELISLFQLLEI